MSQCEYITARGQCKNEAVHPGRFCADHSATSRETVINQYRIANKYLGDTMSRHAAADDIKSLKGELAILRTLMERRLNTIECDAEAIAAMPIIKDFAIAVQKIAESCHIMDVKLGNLLDKGALMTLAQHIIVIISKHTVPFVGTTPSQTDVDEAVEAIGIEMLTAIATMENSK